MFSTKKEMKKNVTSAASNFNGNASFIFLHREKRSYEHYDKFSYFSFVADMCKYKNFKYNLLKVYLLSNPQHWCVSAFLWQSFDISKFFFFLYVVVSWELSLL